jgi:hypothetical protein
MLLRTANQLSIGVWIQSCNLATAQACCLGSTPCCNDSSTSFFTFKPGYLKAVLSGDGTNRLGPYVDTNGVTQTVPTTSGLTTASSTGSSTGSSSTAGTTTTGAGAGGAGTTTGSGGSTALQSQSGTAEVQTQNNTPTIAVGVTLGVLLGAALAGMFYFWRLYRAEKQLRLASETATLVLEDEKPTGPPGPMSGTSSTLAGTPVPLQNGYNYGIYTDDVQPSHISQQEQMEQFRQFQQYQQQMGYGVQQQPRPQELYSSRPGPVEMSSEPHTQMMP